MGETAALGWGATLQKQLPVFLHFMLYQKPFPLLLKLSRPFDRLPGPLIVTETLALTRTCWVSHPAGRVSNSVVRLGPSGSSTSSLGPCFLFTSPPLPSRGSEDHVEKPLGGQVPEPSALLGI